MLDVAMRLSLTLPYFATTGADVSSAILGARAAVAASVSASTSPVSVAAVTSAAQSVPGVIAADRVLLNGDVADVGAPGAFASQFIRVVEVRIEP